MARSRPHPDPADDVDRAVARACVGIDRSTRVCVALSGGIDSTVLLHALAARRNALPAQERWTLTAHHVHHGLSRFADDWLNACQVLCASLDVPLSSERVVIDRESPEGIEAAARAARYQSLSRVDADLLMLAHHRRDQAETVILQLLRGAGPAGLAAMPQATGRRLRPLLDVSRVSIERYAARHGLHAVNDDSNDDTRFTRNRLRHQVWPNLLQAFPSAETTIARAASHQAEAAELLQVLAEIDSLDRVHGATLDLAGLWQLSAARRVNLFRFWLARNDLLPSSTVLHEWLRQLSSTASTQAIELRRSRHDHRSLRVYRGKAMVVDDPLTWLAQPWQGELELHLGGAHGVAGCLDLALALANEHTPRLRAPAANERWLVRSRRAGDVIRLSERSGQVTLKNVMQSAGVPPWLRESWPLLVCNDEIVAVASVATANAFTVRAGEMGRLCEWKPACRLGLRP